MNRLDVLTKLLFLVCLWIAVAIPAYGQAQLAVDPQLEQQLDELLRQHQTNEQRLEAMQTIADGLASNTPIASRVRAITYLAIDYAYAQQFEQAYQLLDEIEQLAEQYGTVDSMTEVLASRIQVKLLEGKTTSAFSLIADTELRLAQTESPRIRYFSHVLIASVYRNRNQLEQALSHLLAATEAVMQTDDSRTTIRRLHVMLQIADIQT